MTKRRIALFGGTFDPPHIGHLVVANEVRFCGGFDEVVLMVANDPWQKSAHGSVSPAPVRLELVRAAVAGHPTLRAGADEIERGGATYTIDTVEGLLAADSTLDISVVVGADTARSLETWHRHLELAALVSLVVVCRPGSPQPDLAAHWRHELIEVPQLDVSSTELRRRVAENEPIDFLVPGPVVDLIATHGIYGLGS